MIKSDYFKHDDSPVEIVYCLQERVMHVKREMNGKKEGMGTAPSPDCGTVTVGGRDDLRR